MAKKKLKKNTLKGYDQPNPNMRRANGKGRKKKEEKLLYIKRLKRPSARYIMGTLFGSQFKQSNCKKPGTVA